jgi:hypothetical protein
MESGGVFLLVVEGKLPGTVVYWNWINFFQLIFFIKKAQI